MGKIQYFQSPRSARVGSGYYDYAETDPSLVAGVRQVCDVPEAVLAHFTQPYKNGPDPSKLLVCKLKVQKGQVHPNPTRL